MAVIDLCLFLMVLWFGLQCLIVAFPGNTYGSAQLSDCNITQHAKSEGTLPMQHILPESPEHKPFSCSPEQFFSLDLQAPKTSVHPLSPSVVEKRTISKASQTSAFLLLPIYNVYHSCFIMKSNGKLNIGIIFSIAVGPDFALTFGIRQVGLTKCTYLFKFLDIF